MDAPATTSADNGTSGGGEGWFTPRKQPTSAPGTTPASESPGTEPQATEGRRLAGLRPVGRGTATPGDTTQGSGRADAGGQRDFGQTDADARIATPPDRVTAPSAPAPFDPATTVLPKLIPAPATAVPPLSSPVPPRRPGDTPPAGLPAADLASAAPSEAFQVPAQRTAPNGPPPAEAAHLTAPPPAGTAHLTGPSQTPPASLTPSEDHHRTLPEESRAGVEGETRPVAAENPPPAPQPEGELPGPFAQEATPSEDDLPPALSQEAAQPDAELLRPFAPNPNPPEQTPPPHDTPAESAPAQTPLAESAPAQTPLAHDATPDTPQPEAPGSYVPDAFRPAAGFSRPTAQSAPQDPAQPVPDAFRPFAPETLEVAEPAPAVEGSPDAVLVRRTMSAIGSVSDKVTSYFYALLFVRHPDLRPLFPPAMDAQRDRLLKALLTAAEHIDNTPVLVGYLQNLGRGHRKYGTRPEHYPAVGECLIEALAKYAASVWDKETEAAWVRTYTTISQVMIDAAAVDELRAPAWWQAEIVSHELRTQDIAVLTVRPDQPYPFLAGQYASLETPWWPRIWRHYSFASAPRSDGLLSFHVKAVPAGWVSNALVHRAQPGDVIRLGPPAGSMTIDHTRDSGLLCLGGGTGIAPIKALVEDVAEHGARRRMEVFYGARTDHDLYDIDTMLRLKQSHSWLEVRPVVDKDGLLQLPDAIRTFGPWNEYDAYISGPVGMIRSGVNALRGAGIPKERIRHDSVAELVAAG